MTVTEQGLTDMTVTEQGLSDMTVTQQGLSAHDRNTARSDWT